MCFECPSASADTLSSPSGDDTLDLSFLTPLNPLCNSSVAVEALQKCGCMVAVCGCGAPGLQLAPSNRNSPVAVDASTATLGLELISAVEVSSGFGELRLRS